jgi:hypothetical protein
MNKKVKILLIELSEDDKELLELLKQRDCIRQEDDTTEDDLEDWGYPVIYYP